MVQALQNGEIDVFHPSNPTADMLAQLEALGDAVTVEAGESLSYSHIDLDTSATGIFNDQRVRQAFAKCVPREELVEKFARPVYPESQVLNLHEVLPAQANYEEALEQVPSAHQYDEVDIEGAKALLAEAGVATPLTVRFTFSQQSSLRADQVTLIKASCDQAGFNVEAKPDPDVFTSLASAPGTWDAAVFGWSGSGLIASGQSIYISTGNQNFGKYANPEVDRIWGELVQVTDRDDALPLQVELEEQLWSNLYNVPLYATPGMTAWSSSLEGPVYNPTQYGATWNADTWTKSAG
jgi:peptide/nickel transport system substrate-binding protein